MKLWAINIRAEIKFGDPRKSDNELILCAKDKDEAEKRAEKFFEQNGLYVKTAMPGTTPRVIETREIPAVSVIYKGNLIENPDTFLKRESEPVTSAEVQKALAMSDTDFGTYVGRLGSKQYIEMLKNSEFRARADGLKPGNTLK
jgi:hypothetical protein